MMKKKSRGAVILACMVLSAFCGCRVEEQASPEYLAGQSQHYFEEAVRVYATMIADDPLDAQALLSLGRLYYDHGRYDEARQVLAGSSAADALKIRAMSFYRDGEFRDALEIFNRHQLSDDEARYYYGLTSERLNLYDQALAVYRQVASNPYMEKAVQRIDRIERDRVAGVHIRDRDPQSAAIIDAAPAGEQYPQAGALILSCDETIEVTAEGTEITTLHYIVKILNERGKEEFSETHVSYDSTFEKVELLFARTIKPDGTVADVSERHIRDVTRYLNFPLYSNARVFIISFPEVAKGSVIEYSVKVHNNRLINKKDFVMSYPLQTHEPIIDCRFTVVLPRAQALHIKKLNEQYNTFGAVLDPRTEERGDSVVYRWQFKDIPQIISESTMPPDVEINPALLLSTFSGWDQVYGWWQELLRGKISADDAIRQAVRGLAKEGMTDREKISALYHYCASQIRYVAVEYGQAGYEPHQAQDIFRNKYGDCKDQAVLLITMLREAGFQAWPVLIATRDYFNLGEDFPSVLFNHAIAAVEFEGGLIFLDPTAETCSFGDLPAGDQGRGVLVFKQDNYLIANTPLFESSHNLLRHHLRIVMNADEGISAQKDVYAEGVYAQSQRYWLLYTQPELIRQLLKEQIQGVSVGAVLSGYTVDNPADLGKPVLLRYSFDGPEYARPAGELRILPQLVSLDPSLVALQERRYPLDFGFLDTKESEYVIEIPRGFAVKYMPSDIKQDSPWFDFLVSYEQRDSEIRIRQRSVFKKTAVSVQEYPRFKEFFENLAVKAKETVILEKKQDAGQPL